MAWVLDSCVLLDIALRDPNFGLSSALFVDARRDDGLAVCPVSVVEIAPEFEGSTVGVREFCRQMGVDGQAGWTVADTGRAADAWATYVRLKRAGQAGKRPVADILIGAFACRFQGLITRNPNHFTPFFPELSCLVPAPAS